MLRLHARQILDSRGNPTVEVEASIGHYTVRASVPSGASTGSHEAVELRDGDMSVYCGQGVLQAVSYINKTIAKHIEHVDIRNQREVDSFLCTLDGTPNKSHFGANAILAVSLALMKLEALRKDMPLYTHVRSLARDHMTMDNTYILPMPMMNILNGGKHADSGLSTQEFMIVPVGANNFSHALQIGAEVFHHLKDILKHRGLATSVGDEGGFAPQIGSTDEALCIIEDALTASGHNKEVKLAMDVAASEFYVNGIYHFEGKQFSSEDLTKYFLQLSTRHSILSIEDGHSEDDITGWKDETRALRSQMMLVGDDLFVTNKHRLEMGIKEDITNSILIKLNQIGTVTETLETIALARKHHMNIIISHRSGETEDTTIADFAVGVQAEYIKTGSLSRTERVCKYNQLLRIEEQLNIPQIHRPS